MNRTGKQMGSPKYVDKTHHHWNIYVHHAVSSLFLHLFQKYFKVAVIALETTNQLAKNENIKATILPFIFRLMTVPTMAEISKLCPKIMYHVYKKI